MRSASRTCATATPRRSRAANASGAAIAGALAAAPHALVLDEPTSQLDPQGAEDVLAAVGRLNADLGTTVVLAEHRLERAAPLADRALRMDGGRITAAPAPTGAVLADYPGAPSVTRLGRLLGWDPPPLTVRDARARATTMDHRPEPIDEPGRDARARSCCAVGASVLRSTAARCCTRSTSRSIAARSSRCSVATARARARCCGSSAVCSIRMRAEIEHRPTTAYVPQDPNAMLFAATVRAEIAETLRLLGRRDDGCRRLLARRPRPRRARRPPPAQPLGRATATGRDRGRRRRWRRAPPARRADPRHGRRVAPRARTRDRAPRGGWRCRRPRHARRRARGAVRRPGDRAGRRRGRRPGSGARRARRLALRAAGRPGAAAVPHRRRGRERRWSARDRARVRLHAPRNGRGPSSSTCSRSSSARPRSSIRSGSPAPRSRTPRTRATRRSSPRSWAGSWSSRSRSRCAAGR